MRTSKVAHCEICGKKFLQYREFHKRCSTICREIATEKTQYYKKSKVVTKECKQCGKPFTTNDKKRKFCDAECYTEYKITNQRSKTTRVRTCAICGIQFETSHAAKKYCTHDCYLVAKKKREKA